MKKAIIPLLTLALLLGLAACGSGEAANEEQIITRANDSSGAETQLSGESAPAEKAAPESFAFVYEGVELVPGEPFDSSLLPEANSVYQVPSCAIEGTDNVYNYGSFELTAFNDGGGEIIYSIYIIEPEAVTPEGLALGDSAEKVAELYGSDCAINGTASVYSRDGTQLSVFVENGMVVAIEYVLIME